MPGDISKFITGMLYNEDIPHKMSVCIFNVCRIAESFVSFHPLWLSVLVFSFDLLGKFLVDMEELAAARSVQVAQVKRLMRFLR